MAAPVYCTKIASRLARTSTSTALTSRARCSASTCEAAAIVRLGAEELTDAQVSYAATDVLHLHALREARWNAGA